MLHETKPWSVFFLLLAVSVMQQCVHGAQQVPCFFIFGDSMFDNGNNNNLNTLARVNYPPYGIDFSEGLTERFSNGRNIIDFIAEHLGFEHYIPSFETAKDSIILQGVNYASGSAGIRDETGERLGQCISLNKQLQNHKTTISGIADILKNNDSAIKHLNKCLYSVGMGSNDYLNNYFQPEYYKTSKQYTLKGYAKVLVDQYSKQIRTLYNYGARKIALFGLGQIGCAPRVLIKSKNGTKSCASKLNLAASLFNKKLKKLINQLNKEVDDARFTYVNIYGMGEGDPSQLGFKVATSACCRVREDGQCIPKEKPCANRTEYVFWDSFHPTEAFNKVTAARAYSSYLPSDSQPFDIRHLVELDLRTKPNLTLVKHKRVYPRVGF